MLKRRILIDETVPLLAILAFLVTILIYLIRIIQNYDVIFQEYFIFFIAIIAVILGFMTSRVFLRTPTSLTISLLGFPGSGKTVYLTVLFDLLQTEKSSAIEFSPYGEETVKRIFKDLSKLSTGIWLPPTEPGTVFYYRAKASIGSGLLGRRYKLEIGDYAGENIEELEPHKEQWLHKTDYFKYVIQSEAILLAVDCEVLISNNKEKIEEMQNAFAAAIHLLIESKGVPENRKLTAPVGILFLKTDLLKDSEISIEELPRMVERLIKICERRCYSFKYFFISAVGDLDHSNSPPEVIIPKNVVQPIEWILKKL